LQPEFFRPVFDYWQERSPTTEMAVRQALTLETTRWQYVTGVADETLVDPGTWTLDHALLCRPGNDLIQLALFGDYATNPPLYPLVQRYFRDSQVPLLAVWGRGDPVFGPAGALAFADDLPDAEIHLLDGGHFLLESALAETASLIREFLSALP
jgi:pimeloyl-ACP methyl ester carboxylesterase